MVESAAISNMEDPAEEGKRLKGEKGSQPQKAALHGRRREAQGQRREGARRTAGKEADSEQQLWSVDDGDANASRAAAICDDDESFRLRKLEASGNPIPAWRGPDLFQEAFRA
nr:unnamed protein product [Digitaria exilis]